MPNVNFTLPSRPLVIDLFCGSFGWSAGFIAEGWRSIGFDLAHESYHGPVPKHCHLVLQDVLTLDGSQFKDADCIVASPPCQEYSYMAMPWSRAKQIAAAIRGGPIEFPEGYTGSRTVAQLTALFDACFRIQREACEAAGRHIPMVVENVKGAQPWVGPAKAHFGSFYFWGDVAMVGNQVVAGGLRFGETVKAARRGMKRNPDGTNHPQGSWFAADAKERGANGCKVGGLSWSGHGEPGYKPQGFNVVAAQHARSAGVKAASESGRRTDVGNGARFTSREERRKEASGANGDKGFVTGLGKGHDWRQDPNARFNSKSDSRKAASAQIARIPFTLASYIARALHP